MSRVGEVMSRFQTGVQDEQSQEKGDDAHANTHTHKENINTDRDRQGSTGNTGNLLVP